MFLYNLKYNLNLTDIIKGDKLWKIILLMKLSI